MTEYLDYIFNLISLFVGGGLMAIVNARANHKKASEEATSVELTNAQSILETNQKYIVEPLTKEIDELREQVQRLTKAISKIHTCEHIADCPIVDQLQKSEGGDNDD